MYFLDVLYANYYRFYKKVIPDPEPHFATVLALSFSESLLINSILQIALLKWLCFVVSAWFLVAIAVLFIGINYMLYIRTGKFRILEKKQLPIANSYWLSVFITWLFFLATTSWLFWGSIYARHLLSQCP